MENKLIITREWAMPNLRTFQIRPIEKKIQTQLNSEEIVSIPPKLKGIWSLR